MSEKILNTAMFEGTLNTAMSERILNTAMSEGTVYEGSAEIKTAMPEGTSAASM